MAADDLGSYFPNGEIAAVEIAEVIGADTEASGNRNRQLGRCVQLLHMLGSDDLNPRCGEPEIGARERSAALAVYAEGAVDQEQRRYRPRVVDRDILDAHRIPGGRSRQDVRRTYHWRPIE